MARPLNTDKEDAAYAQALLARPKNKDEIRMAQVVLLPYRQSMTLAQAAELLGGLVPEKRTGRAMVVGSVDLVFEVNRR